MAFEARWRGLSLCLPVLACLQAMHPFSQGQLLPSACHSRWFLISAPLYIQIAGAQNGNVQVSS